MQTNLKGWLVSTTPTNTIWIFNIKRVTSCYEGPERHSVEGGVPHCCRQRPVHRARADAHQRQQTQTQAAAATAHQSPHCRQHQRHPPDATRPRARADARSAKNPVTPAARSGPKSSSGCETDHRCGRIEFPSSCCCTGKCTSGRADCQPGNSTSDRTQSTSCCGTGQCNTEPTCS